VTNYEKIKAMSVEEMAKGILDHINCIKCPADDECEKEIVGKSCIDTMKEWLLQEAEE